VDVAPIAGNGTRAAELPSRCRAGDNANVARGAFHAGEGERDRPAPKPAAMPRARKRTTRTT
jgi:hypothetical protein